MKKILALLLAAMMLMGCAASAEAAYTYQAADAVEYTLLDDPQDDSLLASGDFAITGGDVTVDGSKYTISSAGEYTITGALNDGQIIVAAGDDDEITLILQGASIACQDDAPIVVLNAGEVTIKAEKDSYNAVTDLRAQADEAEHDAAIWAACDLKLRGKGTLIVTGGVDNGIKSKDDLSVKNITLKVTAPGNALKGNDSIKVSSGQVTLISTTSDGMKTSSSDISKKGNQKGDITLEGGQVDIYAAMDGIQAAHDVIIAPAEDETVTLNIFTADYSEYAGEAAGGAECYLIVPSSMYSSTAAYYAYFYNSGDEANDAFAECTFETMVSGGRTRYYGLVYSTPKGYDSVMYCLMNGSEPGLDNISAASEGGAVNSAMNGWLITGVSGSVISGDWVSVGSSSSSNKTTYSSKGIKAANIISVAGGEIYMECMDDGLHANRGDELENGETGLGDIYITGGRFTITSADDGMHADGDMVISGGYINVVDSHEGLEANHITISGGSVFVYADDDGLNACAGSQSPLITISGGYVDVTTPSGDTDAIDSNGNFVVTGGMVLVKGGSSSGMMAGSVDVDGTVSVTGGCVIALGGICETPTTGSVCTYIQSGASFPAGDYELVDGSGNVLAQFSLSGSYSSVWLSCDAMEVDQSYTLTQNGSTLLSWTQSSTTEGSGGMSGFGGGFGGRGWR